MGGRWQLESPSETASRQRRLLAALRVGATVEEALRALLPAPLPLDFAGDIDQFLPNVILHGALNNPAQVVPQVLPDLAHAPSPQLRVGLVLVRLERGVLQPLLALACHPLGDKRND